MGHWGYVLLAYAVGSVALGGYLVLLKGRLRDAGLEMSALEQDGGRGAR